MKFEVLDTKNAFIMCDDYDAMIKIAEFAVDAQNVVDYSIDMEDGLIVISYELKDKSIVKVAWTPEDEVPGEFDPKYKLNPSESEDLTVNFDKTKGERKLKQIKLFPKAGYRSNFKIYDVVSNKPEDEAFVLELVESSSKDDVIGKKFKLDKSKVKDYAAKGNIFGVYTQGKSSEAERLEEVLNRKKMKEDKAPVEDPFSQYEKEKQNQMFKRVE